MKINAEFIRGGSGVADWNEIAKSLSELNRGNEKKEEILDDLDREINALKESDDEDVGRLYHLIRWIVRHENPVLPKDAVQEKKQRAKVQTEAAQRLLAHLINDNIILPLTAQEKHLLKDGEKSKTLMELAKNLHNKGNNKKTIGELTQSVFTWKDIKNKERALFIDLSAFIALKKRADKSKNQQNERLQVNYLSVAAQLYIISGNVNNAQRSINKLKQYAEWEKDETGNDTDKALNQAALNVLTLGHILRELKVKKKVRIETGTIEEIDPETGDEISKEIKREVFDEPNATFTAKEAENLALHPSTYYDRAKKDPRRSSKGVIVFFACLAILALVLGLGVFIASHGGAVLVLAPAGHLLLSVLGVTTKVAADALAFSLLSMVPLSLLAIAKEVTFPTGSLRRFFGFVFKNNTANKKIEMLSPFYKAEYRKADERLLGGEADKSKKEFAGYIKAKSYWGVFKERPGITLLKTLLYPVTYLVGIFLAAASSVPSLKRNKAADNNAKEPVKAKEGDKAKQEEASDLIQSASKYIVDHPYNPSRLTQTGYSKLANLITDTKLRTISASDKLDLIQRGAMDILDKDAQRVDEDGIQKIKHPGDKFSHLLAMIGVARLNCVEASVRTQRSRGYELLFDKGFVPSAPFAVKSEPKPATTNTP